MVGSIFGGTGASILPQASHIIKDLLKSGGMTSQQLDEIKWSRVLVLPYYNVPHEPKDKVDGPDPDRYSMDSVLALWYYEQVAVVKDDEPFFLVGSGIARSHCRAGFGQPYQFDQRGIDSSF